MNRKFKLRLGRYLGFELHKPGEKQSVSELKASIRFLKKRLETQEHYIAALQQGFTYIRDFVGRFYRLYLDGSVVDRAGEPVTVDWDHLVATLADRSVVNICRRTDGVLQEWARDGKGRFVQVR